MNEAENKSDPMSKDKPVNGKSAEEKNFVVNHGTTDTSEHQEFAHREHFPDIIDVAEMDYSPARRKPPIHN